MHKHQPPKIDGIIAHMKDDRSKPVSVYVSLTADNRTPLDQGEVERHIYHCLDYNATFRAPDQAGPSPWNLTAAKNLIRFRDDKEFRELVVAAVTEDVQKMRDDMAVAAKTGKAKRRKFQPKAITIPYDGVTCTVHIPYGGVAIANKVARAMDKNGNIKAHVLAKLLPERTELHGLDFDAAHVLMALGYDVVREGE